MDAFGAKALPTQTCAAVTSVIRTGKPDLVKCAKIMTLQSSRLEPGDVGRINHTQFDSILRGHSKQIGIPGPVTKGKHNSPVGIPWTEKNRRVVREIHVNRQIIQVEVLYRIGVDGADCVEQ